MFEFLGQLMGIAIRTSCPLELSLPSLVWRCVRPVLCLLVYANSACAWNACVCFSRPLVGGVVTFEDIVDVDISAQVTPEATFYRFQPKSVCFPHLAAFPVATHGAVG